MNPFPINKYIGPEYFCNREYETEIILQNIHNQSNTAFFAQRRIGKTSLVNHVFYQLANSQTDTLFIDILSTEKLLDFINVLASAIYRKYPIQQSIGSKFWESIKLLRPILTLDEFSGTPELSFDISRPQTTEKTIPQMLNFLDSLNVPIIIAIDEFQQILYYPEKNVEAILRTSIQNLQNVHFIFLGSNRKMMLEIFNNSKKPFYESVKNLHLKKIQHTEYQTYIFKTFKKNKIEITNDVIDELLEITKRHTYYTQMLCHELFAGKPKKIEVKEVYNVLNKILTTNEGIYFQFRNLLSKSQWKLLIAVAKEEKVEKPFAKDFIKTHNLGAVSSVKRSLESLDHKEIIYHNLDAEIPYFEVQDKFLMKWLQYKF